jgi:simple sugar transport system permease protein
LHPLGTIPSSIIFGGLLVGANKLQRTVQVPSSLAIALNGLIVIFVVATQIWRYRRIKRVDAIESEPADKPTTPDEPAIKSTEVAS